MAAYTGGPGSTGLENQYMNISLDNDDEEDLSYDQGVEDLTEIDDRWCLVGRFLTERTLDFQAMQHKMATLWRPRRGLFIKDLDANRYLFQFCHEVDITRVIEGSPWTFDRVPLLIERLKIGEDPRTVTLDKLHFWVQLHGMTPGFMSERIVRDVGNRIGTFLEADVNNFNGLWRDYMRVRVLVHVDHPLKRKVNLRGQGGQVCCVQFKYEGLTTFCFICGRLGHSERFCDTLFDTALQLVEKPYGPGMKASPRGRTHTAGSRWLRQGVVYKGSIDQQAAPPPAESHPSPTARSVPAQDTGTRFGAEFLGTANYGIVGVKSGNLLPPRSSDDSGVIRGLPGDVEVSQQDDGVGESPLVVQDSKRKRLDPSLGPSVNGPILIVNSSPKVNNLNVGPLGFSVENNTKGKAVVVNDRDQGQMLGSYTINGSKNMVGAGSGSQARRGL